MYILQNHQTQWKIPKNRTRTVKLTDFSNKWDLTNPFPKGFYGAVILKPVYEIQGVMKCKYPLRMMLYEHDCGVWEREKLQSKEWNSVPDLSIKPTESQILIYK